MLHCEEIEASGPRVPQDSTLKGTAQICSLKSCLAIGQILAGNTVPAHCSGVGTR